MDYKEVLRRFTYEDETDISVRIESADNSNYRENRDIINEIILWKMNRTPEVSDEVIDAIYSLREIKSPEEAVKSERTRVVIGKLLMSKGMKLPMASTVLHFYFPALYPIIDQRAYRELYGMEYPRNIIKLEKLVDMYVKYMVDCIDYHQKNCPEIPFSKIDKLLYQIDKEKGYKVVY